MGATNTTTYYNLSQFVATDKPAWLQDYNGDMSKIDAGIKGALTAAQSAQNTADGATTDISGIASDVTSIQTTVAGHTSDITDIEGDVNTIESLIGNGTPTTTDHTIIGAINEINAEVGTINSALSDVKTYTDSSIRDMGSAMYQDVNITVNNAVLHHIVGVAVTDTSVAVASQCYFSDATTIHVRVIRLDGSNTGYKLTIKYI